MALDPARPLHSVILDEIGLEGLEGITVSGLWIRLSEVLRLPLPLLDRFQEQVWSVVLQAHEHLNFYTLPEPREKLKIWDRFASIDPEYGLPIALSECPYTLYKSVPITDGEILGSCETYNVREPVAFDKIEKISVKEVQEQWGDTFVIVGSQKLRYHCLVPENVSIPKDITTSQYCVLEFIGRARKNGIASAGSHSILYSCKDSAIAFYIRNKLLRLGLITRQSYTEKRSDRLLSSSLLTLVRFHSPNRTAFNAVIEKVFAALKNSPKQRMPMVKLKALFPPENQAMIKKIAQTHIFRKLYECFSVALKELPSNQRIVTLNLDREVLCVKLKNPKLTEDELFNDDMMPDEKESNVRDFYDYKHSHVDMPLMEEIYRSIEKLGSAGGSQSQLCSILSMDHLNVRQAVKKAIADQIITSYCKDMGRQRTNMYVAANCSDSVRRVKEENSLITKNLKCDDEPNIPSDSDPPLKDIAQITATIKEISHFKVKQSPRDETAKQIERKQKVVEEVNTKCIMSVPTLRQEIIRSELEAGYKDEICNKSLCRTIARLHKLGIVRLYEISLRIEENARLYRYVTHPKITPDHHVLQHEIIKLKNMLFLYLEEKKFRRTPNTGQPAKPKVTRVGLIPPGPHKAPKFLTARFIHEFMFHMLFEMQPNQQPVELTEDLLKNWLESEPNINHTHLHMSMTAEHILPYDEKINWKTFIPPLPVYDCKPFGWISLPDVVERMPLSLLNKMIHIPPGVDPIVMEYLLHPIRQHYLIKQLPLTLQGLINRGRLVRIVINIVRLLNRMGLIQVSEKGGKDALLLWVYLNRKASIKDTTTTEAGYLKINADREYTKIKFMFETYNDLQEYWNRLHKICVHTKLGFIHKNISASHSQQRALYKSRRLELNYIVSPVTSFEEAPLLDTGESPGDQLGAGGITSGLYSSFQRNWTWLVNHKHTAAAVAAAQKLKRSRYIRIKLSKLTTTSHAKSTGTPPSMTVKKINRFNMTPGVRIVKRKGTIVRTKHKQKHPMDLTDSDALKQMRSLRARWCAKEDFILKMTRATFLFLEVPVLHFSHRDVARISRDIIRIQCGIRNKTTQACHRRINFLIKTNRHLPELPTWLHALQTNEQLSSRYESDKFFQQLRTLYPNRPEFQNALFVHFLYVFNELLAQADMTEPQDKGVNKSIFPDTLNEFYKQYRECSPLNESKTFLHFNPTSTLDLQLCTINNVLHSSLCCSCDKTQYNLQIFEIFKTYSEDVLHVAFKKARIDGLVVARKKNQIKVSTTQLSGPSYVFSNKYRLSLMFLRIPYVIFDMCYAFFDRTIRNIYSEKPTKLELKSPHSAQLFFLGELLCHNCINVNIKPPSNMLTIDPTAQQSSITKSERIMEHYHNALENAPQTEYLKQFEALGELATRVKFQAGNKKYKLYYHPYDVISKLDKVHVHFFCFLANLNRSLDMTFSRYEEQPDNFCPLPTCVMSGGNYLNAIERIIKDREGALDDIHEDNRLFGDGDAETMTIGVENLMAIFEKYKSFMSTKLAKEDLKDFGKITLNRAPKNMIEICKDVAKAGEDFIINDEYEPTLNKEERIARAHDVFVVNLPTLQIHPNEEILKETELVKYKEVNVPKVLMESALKREEVIDKIFEDTCWTYTNNDMDTLKPIMDEQGFSMEEQEQIAKIYNFIETKEFGAHASDLLERFPDINFLQRALKLLRQHYLVLRAGVASFMFVHKNYVRQWLIHTRHIKRLARENMGKLIPSLPSTSKKRTHTQNDAYNDEEPTPKQSKSNEQGRRVPKPVNRFEDKVEVTTSNLSPNNDGKDLLVIKPVPWIRVNGSLNRRVLDKWMASIVLECTVQNGCTVHAVCLRFKQLHAVDIMFLLELMVDLKMVELRSFKPVKVGLLSNFKYMEQFIGNEFTDPRNTYIVVAPDAITRMTVFIGDKLYRTEFI